MKKRSIGRQIELMEELLDFLGDLQEGLNNSIHYYEKALNKMQNGEGFEELIKKQRVEYFEVTKQNIENLVERIQANDKPFANRVIDRLIDIANT